MIRNQINTRPSDSRRTALGGFLTLALVALVAIAPAQAQSQERDPNQPLPGDDDAVRLSLSEVLSTALENNLDLVSAGYDPLAQAEAIRVEQSAYDVGFRSVYRRDEAQLVQQNITQPSERDADTWDVVQFSKTLNYGGSFDAGFRVNRSVLGGTNAIRSPEQWESSWTLTYRMPFLKGFGKQVTTQNLILARNDLQISHYDLESQALTTIQEVEEKYWDVLAARENIRIANLALKRAQDLLELNRKKVDVGTLAPIEITQAEAGVASERENVIVSEVTLGDAEDDLRRLMGVPQYDPLWAERIIPTDRPDFTEQVVDVERAIEIAMANRPEIDRAKQQYSSQELREQIARKNRRHSLDWEASYLPTGVAPGSFDEMGQPTEEATLGNSVSQLIGGDQFSWNSSLTYSFAIGNREAKASYAQARVNRRKAGVDLQNQEQTIRVDVRKAARGVASGFRRVEAAQVNVRLQREKLDAEEKKFENGMSTSFEVLTFQKDLADAELALINAALDYAKAQTRLERAQGTLLDSRSLSLIERQ